MDMNLMGVGERTLFIPGEQIIWAPSAQVIPGIILLGSLMGAPVGL